MTLSPPDRPRREGALVLVEEGPPIDKELYGVIDRSAARPVIAAPPKGDGSKRWPPGFLKNFKAFVDCPATCPTSSPTGVRPGPPGVIAVRCARLFMSLYEAFSIVFRWRRSIPWSSPDERVAALDAKPRLNAFRQQEYLELRPV